ncbi:16509_t:CDS:2, partial [Entrophospora sp. SA101]
KIKLLTLASKVGKAWLDCGRSDKADEVLRSANLAWKLSNTHIANLMLQNAIDMKYLNNVTENE